MATTAPPVASTPSVAELCLAARDASRGLAALPTATKDGALHAIADALPCGIRISLDELRANFEKADVINDWPRRHRIDHLDHLPVTL